LRSEADKQAKKLEEEAANPIQQMTAKAAGDVLRKKLIRKQMDLVKEADKQAEKLVKQAEKQGDKLINDAEKKAEESIESR
jgi:vacuolar-type H+-ATPase subunit H